MPDRDWWETANGDLGKQAAARSFVVSRNVYAALNHSEALRLMLLREEQMRGPKIMARSAKQHVMHSRGPRRVRPTTKINTYGDW